MDPKAVLDEVGSWPVEERLRLMEEIWEGIIDPGVEPAITEGQRAELELRVAQDNAAPDEVVTWDEIKAAALKRAGR